MPSRPEDPFLYVYAAAVAFACFALLGGRWFLAICLFCFGVGSFIGAVRKVGSK